MNMDKIGDDELCQILGWVTDPADRKSASQVCKGWWLMESLTRSSLRLLNLEHLPRLLARYPNIVTFQTPKGVSNADLALVAQSCPKLEAIKLEAISDIEEIGVRGIHLLGGTGGAAAEDSGISVDELWEKLRVVKQVGDEGLCALANGCPKLSKIVINRSGAGLLGIIAMITSSAHNLTHLDLGECSLVSDKALEAIGYSSCPIRVLSLRLCSKITDAGLKFLADGPCSKTIQQLKLLGCTKITGAGVWHLSKMHVLEELDLAMCIKVTDVGGVAISSIQNLKNLNLAGLHLLTEKTFVALAKNCINLEELRVSNGRGTATASIDAFLGHKCLRSLNLAGCFSDDIKGYALESLALGCPSLESIVVFRNFRERLLQEMQEDIVSRFLKFL
ncbi:F-box protein At3g58530-like [Argentina anserina]|uniref:F-box protein At3g58530-like n=1 Tax=Argentina anserina TaxID=57926 RepID=UPI0021762661|nr:F-box protein At3g58530-like [Potentilla anserina]